MDKIIPTYRNIHSFDVNFTPDVLLLPKTLTLFDKSALNVLLLVMAATHFRRFEVKYSSADFFPEETVDL